MQLVEIPSESENNENIVAYWRPKAQLVGGGQATFAYRQFWCWEPPSRPPLAIAIHARGGPCARAQSFAVLLSFFRAMFWPTRKSTRVFPPP